MKKFKTIVVLLKKILSPSYYSALKIPANKLMITFICVLLFSNTYSQENYSKLPGTKNDCPIIIINNNIISNESFIKNEEEFITQMSIMKDKPNRKEHKFYNLSENGVILVKINKKIITKSQRELNRFFGINKENRIYINGYLIENSDYKIATESIIEIEFIRPDSINKLKNKSINIWILTKKERMNNCQK
jgi:hypothetical protein